jgi:hypothetical protein
VLVVGLLVVGACRESDPEGSEEPAAGTTEAGKVAELPQEPEAAPNEPAAPAEPQVPTSSLFDGKTLGNWGITWGAPLPFKTNYEITLEAMRVDGSDFFCGLTFPVGESFCSLVLGGWGGTLCGLSNIDYYDAANNETTRIVSFENGKWYHVRLHVRPNRIQAWLQEEGEEPLVDMDITDRKIDTRAEMDLCQPMGVATWQTGGAVRNIHMRKLPD